jgi:hypothetical protein
MNIIKLATVAALTLVLAASAALARPSMFPQTPAQIAHDLSNPNDVTYAPSNK